jgi:uncharacterized membrane protein YkoI
MEETMIKGRDLQVVLEALKQYAKENYVDDRLKYSEALVADITNQINYTHFLKTLDDTDKKFSYKALWQIFRDVANDQNWSLKKELRNIYNRKLLSEDIYKLMNSKMNGDLPRPCFFDFHDHYLMPKAEEYVKVIQPKSQAAQEALEEAKNDLKDIMVWEDDFFKG